METVTSQPRCFQTGYPEDPPQCRVRPVSRRFDLNRLQERSSGVNGSPFFETHLVFVTEWWGEGRIGRQRYRDFFSASLSQWSGPLNQVERGSPQTNAPSAEVEVLARPSAGTNDGGFLMDDESGSMEDGRWEMVFLSSILHLRSPAETQNSSRRTKKMVVCTTDSRILTRRRRLSAFPR